LAADVGERGEDVTEQYPGGKEAGDHDQSEGQSDRTEGVNRRVPPTARAGQRKSLGQCDQQRRNRCTEQCSHTDTRNLDLELQRMSHVERAEHVARLEGYQENEPIQVTITGAAQPRG
jgi:hypothetical protein